MARTVLAIPASSAAIEGYFSIASAIQTKRRSNLADKTLNQLVCLKSWGIKGASELEGSDEELEDLEENTSTTSSDSSREDIGLEPTSTQLESSSQQPVPITRGFSTSEDELYD